MASNTLLIRSIFRALIRATNPFCVNSSRSSLLYNSNPNNNSNKYNKAIVLNCLLHRNEFGDLASSLEQLVQFDKNINDDDTIVVSTNSAASSDDDDDTDDDESRSMTLFQQLLRELITGEKNGIRLLQFPRHVWSCNSVSNNKKNRFQEMIRREFRNGRDSISARYDSKIRCRVALYALREINKKLAYMDILEINHKKQQPWHPNQAAKDVYPLPLRPPKSYLRPGVYLIAHPSMTGYFRRSVICILYHYHGSDDDDNEEELLDPTTWGSKNRAKDKPSSSSSVRDKNAAKKNAVKLTYGVIVNRVCVSKQAGKTLTLEEVVQPIPSKVIEAFGSTLVKEGGPVHMSLQMVRSTSPTENDIHEIGGTIVPNYSEPSSSTAEDMTTTTRIDNNTNPTKDRKNVYYNCDVVKASEAVIAGKVDRNDISFFVGASVWRPGQLEREIEQGCWLPCTGNIDIARTGICEHDDSDEHDVTHDNDNVHTTNDNNHKKNSNATTTTTTSTSTTGGTKHFRPRADLWLSMLSACGPNEARLAQLFVDADENHEYNQACNEF